MASIMITEKSKFTFDCSASFNVAAGAVNTLTLFSPSTKLYPFLVKFRPIIYRGFQSVVKAQSSLDKSIIDQAKQEMAYEKTEAQEVEETEKLFFTLVMHLGDDYEPLLDTFRKFLCHHGVCAVGDYSAKDVDATTIYMGDAWLERLDFDEVEQLLVKYGSRYLLPKALLGK